MKTKIVQHALLGILLSTIMLSAAYAQAFNPGNLTVIKSLNALTGSNWSSYPYVEVLGTTNVNDGGGGIFVNLGTTSCPVDGISCVQDTANNYFQLSPFKLPALAQIGGSTVVGNANGSTASPAALTGTQLGSLVRTVPLSSLAPQAANTIVMNATAGSASPTAISLGALGGTNSCAGATNALTYNSSTNSWGCNTTAGGTPGGANTNIQFNNNGVFGGSNELTFISSSGTMTLAPPSGSGGFGVTAFDPNFNSNVSDYVLASIVETTDNAGAHIGFGDNNVLENTLTVTNGPANYGNGTNMKTTFFNELDTQNKQGSGQGAIRGAKMNAYGMSDSYIDSLQLYFAGGPIGGDECQCLWPENILSQQTTLVKTTVTSATATTGNTTVTQNVTASPTVQTVTVASTSGFSVGDWVILNSGEPVELPNQAATQITAIGAGTLSFIAYINMTSGMTITPGTLLTVGSTARFGQDRVLVDETSASYTTGNIASIATNVLTGSGTTWTNGMVGGNANNPCVIELTPDDYGNTPFTGGNPLHSWYECQSVNSNTSLTIYRTSIAGATSYVGNCVSACAYVIRAGARVMKILNNTQVVLNTNTYTWTAADSVELAITPYPDTAGMYMQVAGWTPGGTYRGGLIINNTGAQSYGEGIAISNSGRVSGAGVSTYAWAQGVGINSASFGVLTSNTNVAFSIGTTNYGTICSAVIECFGAQGGDYGMEISGVSSADIRIHDTSNANTQSWFAASAFGQNSTITIPAFGASTGQFVYRVTCGGTNGACNSGNIPSCGASLAGDPALVTDGSATPTLWATYSGGGSTLGNIVCNGAAWQY